MRWTIEPPVNDRENGRHHNVTMDAALIDRIVTNVLEQLQPRVAVRPAPVPTSSESTTTAAAATVSELSVVNLIEPVITASLLQETVHNTKSVHIGAKALLTPAAKDWLQSRKITWSRTPAGKVSADTGKSHIRRRVLVSTVTPAVKSLQATLEREPSGWGAELIGRALEAVETAVRMLSTAEAELLLVFSDQADVIACYANRSPKVRAIVATTAEQLAGVARRVGANLLAVDPTGRSFIELRNLLRAAAALHRPQPPLGWD